MKKISIVVPVFNEEEGLEKTIHQLTELLATTELNFDLIFVNDGSTDNSLNILEKQTDPSIKICHHKNNIGYGAALKTGISNSDAPYICITDADGTYPNHEIIRLAKYLDQDFAMIVGSRTGEHVKIPFIRKFPKWILNKLANYLSGFKIPDLNSGLRIMKKSEIIKFLNILPDGFSFTTTITLAMLTNNLPVHYVPINYFSRKGKSKIRPVYDTLNFFQLIIRTCLYFQPLKVFVPFSLFLVIFAFIVLFSSLIFLGKVMDVTFGVILMSAVIVLAIGMLADLIDKRLG